MGGRTNNAGDWLTGKTQDTYDAQVKNRKASVELLRKSNYTKAINEQTGEEYDFAKDPRFREGLREQMTEEQWKEFSESYIANIDKDPIDTQRNAVKDAPATARPMGPDLTDESIKKARTAAFLRLQTGKNQSNSFATKGTLGGFDVGKPVLGGY